MTKSRGSLVVVATAIAVSAALAGCEDAARRVSDAATPVERIRVDRDVPSDDARSVGEQATPSAPLEALARQEPILRAVDADGATPSGTVAPRQLPSATQTADHLPNGR